MSEVENNKEIKSLMQFIDFEAFCKLFKMVDLIHKVEIFQMPDDVSSFGVFDENSNKGEAYSSLINEAISYKNDKNSWRIKSYKNLNFKLNEDSFEIGDYVIKDLRSCIIIPEINMVVIIPDKKTYVEGKINPSNLIFLFGMISMKPLMMTFDVKENGDGTTETSVTYKMVENHK